MILRFFRVVSTRFVSMWNRTSAIKGFQIARCMTLIYSRGQGQKPMSKAGVFCQIENSFQNTSIGLKGESVPLQLWL